MNGKLGRPSRYTAEVGDIIYSLMSEGLSLRASAGAVGLSRSTVYLWKKKFPEFNDLVERGQAARTYKLETILLNTDNPTVARTCRLALINSAPDEWSPKRTLALWRAEKEALKNKTST